MDLLLGIVTTFGWWAALFAIIFAYWLFLFAGLHEEGNAARDRWVGILRKRDFEAHYSNTIMRGMDWLDRRLTPELLFDPEPKPRRTAFSFRLLNITLVLAFLYPIVSLMVQWVISGADASVGGLVIIPAEGNRLIRGAAIGGLALEVWMIILAGRRASKGRTGFAVFGPLMLAVAVAVAFAVAVAGAFAGAVAGAFAFAFAFAFAVAVAVAFAVAVAVAFAFAFAFAFVIAFAVAFAVAVAQEHFGEKRGTPGQWLFWYAATVLAAITFAVMITPEIRTTGSGESGAGIILFIGLLPLLNGLLDFLSAGMTRYLVRRGGANPFWWLADAAFACITLFALAAGFIAFVVFAVPQNNEPLLNLARLFHDIRSKPVEYWWLSFMLFSTLLPTLIHAVIALSTVHFLIRKSWRLWVADEISETVDKARARRGKLALALMNTVAWWVPIFVVLYVGLWVWTVDNGLRDLLVDWAEWLAIWLYDFRNGAGSYVPMPVSAAMRPLSDISF